MKALWVGLENVDHEWGAYAHVTDAGIATEAYRRATGSVPSRATLARTEVAFLRCLSDAYRHPPVPVVPSASALLAAMPRYGETPALATGAWHRAACLKLRSAGLRAEHLILASAEDGPARLDVFRTALARAAHSRHGHGSETRIERVVAIGDGVWDVAVARELAVPFIGRRTGGAAERLARAGARTVLSDF